MKKQNFIKKKNNKPDAPELFSSSTITRAGLWEANEKPEIK